MEEIGAVHLAIPTGAFLEEGDSTLIEVKIDGKSVYAAVSMPFGWYFVPSKKWLEKHVGEFLCWVAYENGNPAHPVVIGFRPNKNKTAGKDYPDMGVFKTQKYRWEINDVEGFSRQEIEEGTVIKQTKENILLGSDEAKEPALLGDKTVDMLKTFITAVKNLKVMTNTGASIEVINILDFEKVEQMLDSIKSNVVKLD